MKNRKNGIVKMRKPEKIREENVLKDLMLLKNKARAGKPRPVFRGL